MLVSFIAFGSVVSLVIPGEHVVRITAVSRRRRVSCCTSRLLFCHLCVSVASFASLWAQGLRYNVGGLEAAFNSLLLGFLILLFLLALFFLGVLSFLHFKRLLGCW